MATLEVREESLVWLYNKHKENHQNVDNLLQFVRSLGLTATYEHPGFEVNKNYVTVEPNRSNNCLFTAPENTVGKKLGATAEVLALTLKVLFFLKSVKNDFIAVDIIPALQNQDWNFTADLTDYFLKKNLIKVIGKDSRVLVQITSFGLQYLHACEATAC